MDIEVDNIIANLNWANINENMIYIVEKRPSTKQTCVAKFVYKPSSENSFKNRNIHLELMHVKKKKKKKKWN